MNLEFSTQKICAPSNAVKIDPKKDVNYYETLCMFCSDNDIDLSDVSDDDFNVAVDELSKFGFGFEGPCDPFWFWVKK